MMRYTPGQIVKVSKRIQDVFPKHEAAGLSLTVAKLDKATIKASDILASYGERGLGADVPVHLDGEVYFIPSEYIIKDAN